MGNAGNAKVQDLGFVAAAQKNVGWFDVAMHHTACMCVGQGVGHAAHQLCGLRRCGLPASRKRLAQVAPMETFHGDVHTVGRQAGVVDGDDVRVAQAGGCPGFIQEQAVQGHPLCHLDVEVQGLDGHAARQQGIPGFVHLTQPALAQWAFDGVAPDVRQRGALFDRQVGRCGLTVQDAGVRCRRRRVV